MSGDWQFDFVLTDAERQLVLRRIAEALFAIGPDSPLSVLLKKFQAQVQAGTSPVQLPVDHLDLVGKIHWSNVLEHLSTPTGVVSCRSCSGAGTVPLPRGLVNLQTEYDYAYTLSALTPADRSPYLQESPDPKVRERKAAAARAELELKAAAQRRADARYAVQPGTRRGVLEEADA